MRKTRLARGHGLMCCLGQQNSPGSCKPPPGEQGPPAAPAGKAGGGGAVAPGPCATHLRRVPAHRRGICTYICKALGFV